MESSRPEPENIPQEGSENIPKKRGLKAWLLRNTESPFSGVEKDEDEESIDKPKKKFRKFFKGLFKSVVEPPQSPEAEDQKRPKIESLFFGWEDYENTPSHTTDETLDTAETDGANLPTVTETNPEEFPNAPVTAEITQETTESEPDNHLEFSTNETRTGNLPPEIIPPVEQTPEWQHITQRPEIKVTEKEVVIERGPGMALPVVLVGAEYLARKRADRKLEGRVTEKIESVEKDAKQKEFARAQLETLVKQNREQLEILKRGRSVTTEKQPTQRPEKSEIRQEKAPVHQEVAKSQSERPRPEVRQPEEADKREQYKIMEQVADAAEHNRPVEIAFERSHEVKDDISIPSSAASIGAIMAEQAAEKRRIARAQAIQRQIGDSSSGLPVISGAPSNDLYKQAMKGGFWAAMAIIILGLLAYLLK